MSISTVIVMLFAAYGTYFFLRTISLSILTSLTGAILFSFSGFFITHLQHFNLVQTASFLPWQLLSVEKILKNKKLYYVILVLLTSQQIFSGFYQVALYSQIVTFLYIVTRTSTAKNLKYKIKPLLLTALSLAISWLVSAIQIIPSLELISKSTRSGGLSLNQINQFPFNPKDLLGFINPFFSGNPRFGTYPPFSSNQGVFWENTGYIGIIGLILAILSPLLVIKHSGKLKHLKNTALIAWLLTIICISLSLGKSAPTFLLFLIPPLNFFRVPSRFLLGADIGLVISACLSMEIIKANLTAKWRLTSLVFQLGVILIITTDIFLSWYNYHLTVDPTQFFESQTAQFIKSQDDRARVFSVLSYYPWNRIFLTKGWNKQEEQYRYFLNALDPNSNLLFDVNNVTAYQSLLPRRQQLIESIINNGIFINQPNNQATISASSITLLQTLATNYLISPIEINNPQLKLIYTINTESDSPNYRIYRLIGSQPRFRFISNTKKANSPGELIKLITDTNFNPETDVVTEREVKNDFQMPTKFSIKLEKDNPQEKIINLITDTNSLLVIANSYYPGWKAYLDKTETPIMPANINQQLLYIPAGQHKLILKYQPESLKFGTLVSLISLMFLVLLFWYTNCQNKLKLFKRYVQF
ncbi:MAG: hypothetical protein QXO27_04570 [Candidatus Aenigmatarchaeota archaeon]